MRINYYKYSWSILVNYLSKGLRCPFPVYRLRQSQTIWRLGTWADLLMPMSTRISTPRQQIQKPPEWVWIRFDIVTPILANFSIYYFPYWCFVCTIIRQYSLFAFLQGMSNQSATYYFEIVFKGYCLGFFIYNSCQMKCKLDISNH